MGKVLAWPFAAAVLTGPAVGAQQKDADVDRLVEEYHEGLPVS